MTLKSLMPYFARLVAGLLVLAPVELHAHVKWFVPLDSTTLPNVAPFDLADGAVQLWLVIALLLVGASLYLDRRLPVPAQPSDFWQRVIVRCLPALTGLSLLLSAEAGSVIAPHYHWDGSYGTLMLALEAITGLLLIFPPTAFFGGASLLLLYLATMVHFGPLEVVEYFNVVGTCAFLFCAYHPSAELRRRLEPQALPSLRICTGIALVKLGFAEKLLRPDYAQDFLDTYMWNFMQNLGLAYSDRLFILSAGTMEIVFGMILILGTTTRLNIIAISGFMLTSNISFLAQGHMREAVTEIIGHLPIMAMALLCVSFGNGDQQNAPAQQASARRSAGNAAAAYVNQR